MPISLNDSNFCIAVLLKCFLQLSGRYWRHTLLVILKKNDFETKPQPDVIFLSNESMFAIQSHRLTIRYPVLMISFVVPNPLCCQDVVGGFRDGGDRWESAHRDMVPSHGPKIHRSRAWTEFKRSNQCYYSQLKP